MSEIITDLHNAVALKPFKGVKRVELKEIPFPCGASYKHDGIRGMCYGKKVRSTTGKLIPNGHIQNAFDQIWHMVAGIDCELMVGAPNHPNAMQLAMSGVMCDYKEVDFKAYVFDDFSVPNWSFSDRYNRYQDRVFTLNNYLQSQGLRPFFEAIEYREITNQEEYDAFSQEALELRFEGTYGKAWHGKYKHGRSGKSDPICWKDKPWTDEEGVVVGFVELMHNENEMFIDELGYQKRSSKAEGKVPSGYLGSFIVHNPKYGMDFRVGAGTMTMEMRKYIWENREKFLGQILTYKFFDFGIVDVPRSALFKSWRHPDDISE